MITTDVIPAFYPMLKFPKNGGDADMPLGHETRGRHRTKRVRQRKAA